MQYASIRRIPGRILDRSHRSGPRDDSDRTHDSLPMNKIVIRRDWIETERGWGQRPDGYSLHLTPEDMRDFIDEYWESQPKEVPDEYSSPTGYPYPHEVSPETYEELRQSKNGIRR